jgi:hypothetical protein
LNADGIRKEVATHQDGCAGEEKEEGFHSDEKAAGQALSRKALNGRDAGASKVSLKKGKPALRANWGARSAGLEEENGKRINAC